VGDQLQVLWEVEDDETGAETSRFDIMGILVRRCPHKNDQSRGLNEGPFPY
jgi:hypothetical protein